jgi:hypothetical protein
MTDRPDVSPWRKLIGITLLSSMFVLPARVPRIFLTAGHVTMMIADDNMSTARPVSKPW